MQQSPLWTSLCVFEVTVRVTCRLTAATSAATQIIISSAFSAASHRSAVLMIPPPPAVGALRCRYETFVKVQ